MEIWVRDFLNTSMSWSLGRAPQGLDLWVSGIKGWFQWWQVLFLRVGVVGILPLLNSLRDASRIPLGILDLLQRLGIRRAPNIDEIEESEGRIKRASCLLSDFVRLDNAFCPIQGLLSKLFDVGLGRGIVYNGIFVRVFVLGLVRGGARVKVSQRVLPRRIL